MEIKVTSGKPIAKKPYNIPIPKQRIVEEIVDELWQLGIIRKSESLYASPIVLVRKQNGEEGLCVDCRELNAVTEKQVCLKEVFHHFRPYVGLLSNRVGGGGYTVDSVCNSQWTF